MIGMCAAIHLQLWHSPYSFAFYINASYIKTCLLFTEDNSERVYSCTIPCIHLRISQLHFMFAQSCELFTELKAIGRSRRGLHRCGNLIMIELKHIPELSSRK